MEKETVKKPKIVVIVGQTASGKSDLAVSLAKEFNGEVISADSRQVYEGLDIGTGKVTKEEMGGIPHHLLDVANPSEQFSVTDFVSLGRKAITDILEKGRLPIIAGGTGFYISTLLGEVEIPEAAPNPELRKILENKTLDELFEILKEKDPVYAEVIDSKNRVRLIRAIEIVSALGSMPKLKKATLYTALKIGISIGNQNLEEKIKKRLEARLESGMIKEAEELHKKGLSYERMEEIGLEYRYLARFLQKEISLDELKQELAVKIHQYAKRQKTWFKRDEEIMWIEKKGDAANLIKDFLLS